MISQFAIDIPCPCGWTHKVPLDLHGVWRGLCPRRGKASELKVDASQFATLSRNQAHEELHVDKVWTVHRAGEMNRTTFQQTCEDCGLLLVDYMAWVRVEVKMHNHWWKAGALVGTDGAGNWYRGLPPLSPLRERRCFHSNVM